MEESKEFQTRAESLAEKLKDSRESERKLEEKFRAELSAQTRLANLYKSHSEEHNAKVEDLGKVVTNLQNMLKESNMKQQESSRKQEEQLQNLSKQVSDISIAGLNISGEEASDSKSQLMAIIKHLRQEKDILTGRLEVEEADNSRLESRHDYLKKELEEAKGETALKDEEQKALKESLAAKDAEIKKLSEDIARLYNNNDVEDSSGDDFDSADEENPEFLPSRKRRRKW